MSKTYRLAQYRREAKREPFTLELDDGTCITVNPPSGGSVLQLDPSKSTREVLRLLAGDSYQALVDALADDDASVLVAVLRDMQVHFGLGG
ncbi:hypothetical protein ABZ801_01030 [Actinomadura sp. NPDC047616]|uniref:hypothetical protein n=1 Tax=Actinomadura sp. NPDC047616 TaxID=3155914 RepID=UPI0033E93A3B